MKPKITIVNEKDEVIGSNYRGSLAREDIYRVSALWITNSKGDILLAKRHHTKAHHPSRWGPAVAGTVEENETYEENIIKEAEEELGLKNLKPTIGPKIKTGDEYQHFTQWYILEIDTEIDQFQIQEDEVEKIKWFTQEELRKLLDEHPKKFLPSMKKYFKLF